MPEAGDRVQVPARKVGETPREGVVTEVAGTLLRVQWSTGEETTFLASMGSLMVTGKATQRSGRGALKKKTPTKAASKKPGAATRARAAKKPGR